MPAIYDNWEKLVEAVLKKEQLWQLFHSDSVSPSISSSDSSGFSFCNLASSLDDAPLGFPKQDGVGNKSLPRYVEKIQVPELGSHTKWGGEGDAKQQSYPLPLPPNSAAKSPSHGEEYAWKKGRLIYRGVLGGVYCGFNSEKGGMCAMKEIPLSSDGDRKQSAKMLENEIAVLSSMRHPNIVQYYGSEMVADRIYIYFEYMSRGSIYMILEQFGRLGESAVRSYTQQILSGLAYMHSKSIVHGDIKGANILLDPTGIIKLTNFGIEKQIAEKFRISWMMDSPYWMAPEVIMNANVRDSAAAADIWSLGCTVLEMATAKPPLSHYDGAMAIFKVAYHEELPSIPDHLSADCKDFLRQCLQWNPMCRATAHQLLEHPFVKGSSPLREQILVSTSSSNPAVANAVEPEIYTPRNVLSPTPTSPIGSPLVHPRSPQQLSRRTSPSNSSTPIASIQLPHLNQSMIHQESFGDFPKQSPNSHSPSYWDPNILQRMLKSRPDRNHLLEL